MKVSLVGTLWPWLLCIGVEDAGICIYLATKEKRLYNVTLADITNVQ